MILIQKIQFTNPKGIDITIGGAPYLLSHIDGTSEVDAFLEVTQASGVEGAALRSVTLAPRIITVSGTICVGGDDRKQMYALKQSLINAINPKISGKIAYTNDNGRWEIDAVPQKTPVFGTRVGCYLPFIAYFYCANPAWTDEEKVVPMAYMIGGLQFPFSAPFGLARVGIRRVVKNEGSLAVPVVVEFSGPSANPTITNETVGKFICVNKELYEGETLYIDTTLGKNYAKIKRYDGTMEDATNMLDPRSDFFKLELGDNVLTYNSNNSSLKTKVKIKYKNTYVGV